MPSPLKKKCKKNSKIFCKRSSINLARMRKLDIKDKIDYSVNGDKTEKSIYCHIDIQLPNRLYYSLEQNPRKHTHIICFY